MCADEFDGEIGEIVAEMGWTHGVDGGRENGRVDGLREQVRRKRGRPRLRWKDCVSRDINKVGVVGEWRKLVEDRWRLRSIVFKAGQKCGAIGAHSLKREKEKKKKKKKKIKNILFGCYVGAHF